MKNFNYHQSRLWRAAEHAFLDTEKGSQTITELFEKLISDPNKQNKAQAMFQIFKEVLPAELVDKTKLKPIFYDDGNLPFNPDLYQFQNKIGSGGESETFLLESKQPDLPSYVLKIDQTNTEKNLDELINTAKKIKTDLDKIYLWYQNIPEVLPRENLMIVENPQRPTGKPVIIRLQKFMGSKLRDLFSMTPQEVMALAKTTPKLARQLSDFADITLRLAREQHLVADISGENNLNIAETSHGLHLVFLDPHLINSTEDKKDDKRIKYLSQLEQLADMLNAK